jgi:DNA topoisomerase-1
MHLIVTEKHNAAQQIAAILSGGAASTTRVKGQTIYRWGDKRCLGLAGHIVEVDFPEEYNDWEAIPPSALTSVETETRASKPTLVSALRVLAKDASKVTIATDYDREGELIGKEAYDIVREANASVSVDRVRFSSLTAGEVRSAFADPDEIDFDLAAAGEARQVIDLVWGAALTRFLTLASQRRGNDFVSVGRVQTPTLKLLVDRERAIEDFEPDDYWELFAEFAPADGDSFEGQYYYLDEDDTEAERVWKQETALRIGQEIREAGEATITDATDERRADNPPIPFDTTEFLSAAGAIGFDAKPAMSIAEDLYTDGWITYPRTDNTVYPDDLDPEALVETLGNASLFADDAEWVLDQDDISPTSGDTETTDHPPVHPTGDLPADGELSDAEWEIYKLVVRRFFATLAPAGTWVRRRLDLEAGGHRLKANGKQLADPGYHRVYPYFETEETPIPDGETGDVVPIADLRADDKQTRPPNRYSQSQLIERMAALGIGTKSTRHNTIDKLYDRGYVDGNPPQPTSLARGVVTAIEEYAESLASEEMTAQLEADMTAIADGGTSLSAVTGKSRRMLDDVFDDLEGAEQEIGELIDTPDDSDGDSHGRDDDGPVIGDCPECGASLVAREAGESRFIGCQSYPDCEHSLPLPNKGRPHAMDEVCDDHGLHHVKMLAGSHTFVFGCPQCQQETADETDDRIIGDCPECGETDDGKLAIKRVRSGSRLVGCDRYPDCEYSLPLPRNGEMEVTDEMCDEHDLPELNVHQEDSNVWNLGCPICNYEEYTS